MSYQILIADDEAEIRDLLRLYLENESYTVIEAKDGEEALRLFSEHQIDLCILDVMMPKMDGFRVLKKLRETSNIPVLMLSAKREDSDKILGLNLGADDYLAKPFNPLEAAARVNSAIRRYHALGSGVGTGNAPGDSSEANDSSLTVRDLTLDLEACVLYRNGEQIALSSSEYKMMELFLRHPGKVFTKQQIFEAAWGEYYAVSDNNIMVAISKLRTKLDREPMKYIKTIRGLGYRFEKD